MRFVLVVWLIALFSLTNISAADRFAQDAPPITVEAYWERVETTRQSIAGMEALSATEIRRQLDDLADEWEKVTAVEFPGGRVTRIDSSRLLADLRTDPPNPKRLLNLIDALLEAHAQYPREVFTTEDIEPLKEILARPEFQWDRARIAETPAWVQRIFDAFANFLDRLLFGVENAVYYGRVPIMIASVVLFLLVLYFISNNLARNLAREARLAAEEESGALTSQGALQRAQALSGQGDYRNAIRYLYLSSLLVLDERGLLRYDRSRTNREYLRSVASKPELESPLHRVIDVFDRVWYGFESVDEQTYRTYVAQVEELREKKE